MAETSIRWAFVNALVQAVRVDQGFAAVDAVAAAGWPGDEAVKTMPRLVYVSNVDGDLVIPLIQAGRKQRDDTFDVTLSLRVIGTPKKDPVAALDEAVATLGVMWAAVEDVLANDPGLDDLDGLTYAEVTGARGPLSSVLPQGPIAFGEMTVTAKARYS